MDVFESARIGRIKLRNRIIRSATIMKLCDADGFPTAEYGKYYMRLAQNKTGMIITGFTYISRQGRAMHPGQAGMESEAKAIAFKKITGRIHEHGCPVIMQLSHTGRQTTSKVTGGKTVSASSKRSPYFKEIPHMLTTREVESVVMEFADSAYYAKLAGFDGIQLHAAHGYLIHQFILPYINNRKDRFGVNPHTGIGTQFLGEIIDSIKERCEDDFPVLVKVSGGDDFRTTFSIHQFISLIRFLDKKGISAIEISYGTMDYALNIFRGSSIPFGTILKYNPVYRTDNRILKKLWRIFAAPYLTHKLKTFIPMYNLPYAVVARENTEIPIICVGGFRRGSEIIDTIKDKKADFISLSRPLLCEPDFILKIKADNTYISKCINCNKCAVMVDSPFPTACYHNERGEIL